MFGVGVKGGSVEGARVFEAGGEVAGVAGAGVEGESVLGHGVEKVS